jgi:hypothetical protein
MSFTKMIRLDTGGDSETSFLLSAAIDDFPEFRDDASFDLDAEKWPSVQHLYLNVKLF